MKAAAIILSIIGVIVMGLGVVCFVFHNNMAEDVELFSDMLLLPDDIDAQEVIELLQEFGYEFDPISLLAYKLGALPLIVGAVLLVAGIVLLVLSGKKPGSAGKAGEPPLRPGFMKCPGCGNQIPLGTTFCVECGHSFTRPEPARPAANPPVEKPAEKPAAKPAPEAKKPEFVQCLECGHVNKGTDSFCTNCGTALRGSNVAAVPAKPAEVPAAVKEEPVVVEEPVVHEEPVVIPEELVVIPEEPVVVPEEPVVVPEEPVVIEEPVAVPEEPVVIEEPVVVPEEPAVIEEPVVVSEESTAETGGFRISSSLKTEETAKPAAPGRKYLKKAGDL